MVLMGRDMGTTGGLMDTTDLMVITDLTDIMGRTDIMDLTVDLSTHIAPR